MRRTGGTPKNPKPLKAAASNGVDAAVSQETMRRLGEAAGVSVWTWQVAENLICQSGGGGGRPGRMDIPLDAMLERIDPADRNRVKRRLRAAARSGRSGTMQLRSAPSAGSRFLSGTFFPIGDTVPATRLQIIIQDVTQAVETERALRASVTHYRQAVELNPEIPWVAGPDGSILEVGPRWLELMGMSADRTLGTGWLTALHPDDVAPTVAYWAAHLASGEPVDVEYRVRLATGEYRWMRARAAVTRDADGQIKLWYGTLEDVHDRKLAETALRESEEFARSILESSNMAIEVLDPDGRLVFMNGPGMRIMEVDDFAKIERLPYDSFWPADVAPAVRYAIAEARKGETVRRTLYGPTALGKPRWWDLSVSPVPNAEGKITRLLALSRDVTEAKRNEVEVAAAARRLSNVLESTMDSVVSVGPDWRITYMNRRAAAFFPSDLPFVGRDFRELIDPGEAEPFLARYRQAMHEQRSIAFEDYLPSIRTWLEVQAYGSNAGLIIFFRDVTERRRAQEQIAHLARHDSLTGLPNRLHFHDELGRSLADTGDVRRLVVMSVDLDDFKLINDTLGHLAGDRLLREVAMRLGAAGSGGFVGRLGGDEFALFMRIEDAEQAATTARSIIRAISSPYQIDGEVVEIGASVGIAVAADTGADADTLLHQADIALYRVKAENGRNFRFFEQEMDHALRERREMKRELGNAIGRDELTILYQPQIDVQSNRLVGFEALLRWNSPTRGPVSPAVFIPLAEESGLIEEIGAFVLRRATAEAVRWPDGIGVAVNLSPAQFKSGAVGEAVIEALKASGLEPGRLELEITESVLLDQSSGAIGALEELHAAGVRVALDDFGTGYSSLSYLQRFDFDKLKIDRSFISGLPGNQGSVAIVRAIVGLGRSLRTRVTAEGVETFEQLMFLAEEGCDEAQGYLFSQPMPAEQALALALTRGRAEDLTDRRMRGHG
jgi:diguanylate cyclase (GGDEF)-like protein/PAS domain S-box-containing protein